MKKTLKSCNGGKRERGGGDEPSKEKLIYLICSARA